MDRGPGPVARYINNHLTIPVGNGRGSHDALPQTWDIGVFGTIKKNSTSDHNKTYLQLISKHN